MNKPRLESTSGNDPDMKVALARASLLTDDITDEGRAFFVLRDTLDAAMAFSGLETCGADRLLRSVVVIPGEQAKGHGNAVVRLTLTNVPPDANVFLVTTSAASFFAKHGFVAIPRSELPEALPATRQLSGLCSASATVMKLTRPPT